MGGVVGRAIAGAATLGTSELVRKKPFQAGGPSSAKANFLTGVAGPYAGSVVAATPKAAELWTDAPKVPEVVKPAGTDDAAVQQVTSELARSRSRARGYRSTMLSQNLMSSDNPALKTTYGS